MSEFKLSNDFNVSIEEASEFIKKFFEGYPQLGPYFERVRRDTLKNGYVLIDSVTNRISWTTTKKWEEINKTINDWKASGQNGKLPSEVWKDFFTMKGKIERIAQNYPIQGTSASMTKYAAYNFFKWTKENGYLDRAKLILMVHDEIVVEADEDIAELVEKKLQEIMIDAGSRFCKKVPISTSTSISNYWTH